MRKEGRKERAKKGGGRSKEQGKNDFNFFIQATTNSAGMLE